MESNGESREAAGAPGGYSHPGYAQSLLEFGEVRHLRQAGAWLLVRDIPATTSKDAIGPYPLFTCENYDALPAELAALPEDLITVAVVPDPLSGVSVDELKRCFDLVNPFKAHFLVDLEVPFSQYLRRHHRRYAQRGKSAVEVVLAENAQDHVEEWTSFYAALCGRHGISGVRAFSRRAFDHQLAVPGCHYFRALHEGSAVAGLVCYLDRGRAYAHLVGASPAGQELMAQYALYWHAIEFFRSKASVMDLGAVPGYSSSAAPSGISFFKAGWATSSVQTYFCGKVLNEKAYEALRPNSPTVAPAGFFPAYRLGNFG